MKIFKNFFKDIDELDLKIMKNGLKFSFIILIISIIILAFYLCFKNNLILYTFGLLLFKTSTYFAIEFIICGVIVDSIKKGIA